MSIASINTRNQLVISGQEEAIDKYEKITGKKPIKLSVSGAFHSSLMRHAKVKFGQILKKIEIKKPQGIWISSTDPSLDIASSDNIRNNLMNQLVKPTLFAKAIESLKQKGVVNFIVPAPSLITVNLIKRNFPEANIFGIENKSNLEKLRLAVNQGV